MDYFKDGGERMKFAYADPPYFKRGKYAKTCFEYSSSLQWTDIKDPGVALTTLGVTDSDKEPI